MQLSCTCGRKLRVGDDQVGERVKCPACGKRVLVPQATASPAAATSVPAAVPQRREPGPVADPTPPPPSRPTAPPSERPISTPASAPEIPARASSEPVAVPPEAAKSGSTPRKRSRVRVPVDDAPVSSPANVFAGMVLLAIIAGGLWWLISRKDEERVQAPSTENETRSAGVAALQNVTRLVYSHDGKRLLVAIRNATIREGAASQQVWDLAGDKLLAKVAGHSAGVSQVALSPAGSMFATSSGLEREIRTWEISNGRMQRELIEAQTNPPLGEELLAFSPDGKYVLSIMQGFVIKMEADTPIVDRQLFAVNFTSKAAASPVAPLVAVSMVHRERPPRAVIELYNYDTKESKSIALSNASTALAFSYDGSTLASANGDGTIQIFDVATQQLKTTLPKPKDSKHQSIKRMVLDRDGKRICLLPLGAGKPNPEVWDVATGRHRVLDFQNVADVAISPDGETVVLGVSGGLIRFVDASNGIERSPN